ncbi:MAG: hypothetical protein CVU11_13400 [Bacteroidetes bacterium HGW-Bacteroidetes-6]|jgi:PKD repeat protein|nr:MAG: hypothetical protein CVU11_13400 [Bacteroidetes bacterium HGW-Bacteroidetes-6]
MKFRFTFLLLSLSLTVFSQTLTQSQQVSQILQDRGEVVLKFNVNSKTQINEDLTNIISIDNVKELANGQGYEVIAYANAQEYQAFLSRSIPYEIIQKSAPKALTMATTVAEMASWDRYPIYSVYEQMMVNFANTYPAICDIDTILSSTPSGNYRILVAKISDNVHTAENEPQFLYSSSMHGDETTGYYLMLRLINYLLSNYGSVTQVTNLVNNAEIWICPLANPEGTYYGSSPVGSTVAYSVRNNLAGVDLNRNYPDPRAGQHPDGELWQAETQAFMTFADNHHFNMSANFHGGAEVTNYPWDTWTTSGNPNADVAWWERVCANYVATARVVSPTYMTDTYSSGVTEGGDWYVIAGGRQDYMNYFKQCRELTIELDGVKTTETQNLNGMWNTNYQALLNYIQESLYGIRGVITDSCSGQPIRAKVFANSYDQTNDSSHVYSALPVGNYHKYVNTGIYSLTFSAPGYVSKTISGISVTNGTATYQNVTLTPLAPSADFSADVTSTCSGIVQFSNDGIYQTGSTFLWNFGDGNISTQENPTHTYLTNGNYTVKLKITSCAGTDSITKVSYIAVNMPLAPTTEGDSICGDGSVSLTASGSGTINWYDALSGGTLVGTGSPWNTPFLSTTTTYYAGSDITTVGAAQHVGMTDNSGGGQYFTTTTGYRYMIFDVSQDIRLESVKVYVNSAGSRTIYLQNNAGLTLDSAVVTVPTGQNPYLVTLNFDIAPGTGYRLGVKTGSTNNLYIASGPSYPYSIPGVISITGNNQNQSWYYFFFDWIVKTQSQCNSPRVATIAKVTPLPTATFNYNIVGADVDFTNTGASGASYHWDFGDGNTSTLENPSNNYGATGSYDVTLVVTNSSGCIDSTTQTIVINNAPSADFSANTACLGASTLFTDNSGTAVGTITGWDWNFGDGAGVSSSENPSYVYGDTGVYNVTLIVESSIGLFDTTTVPVYVSTRPLAGFSYVAGFVGNATTVNDMSQSFMLPLTSWNWTFGDGNSSVQQNTFNVYNTPGLFTITLIVANTCGLDTATQQVNIVTTGLIEYDRQPVLYPNPASGSDITIEFVAENEEIYVLNVFGADGRLVYSENDACETGNNKKQINIANFAKGSYWVELRTSNNMFRLQFVK